MDGTNSYNIDNNVILLTIINPTHIPDRPHAQTFFV